MSEGYRKSVLPNGIRILTERMPHVRSVAVGVWVETGSRHEPEPRGGVSHLIEHLVFKGTATRSAEAIARTMDSVGGQMDAFTTKEHTCFYVQVLDEHLPLAVDLLTDILLHPLFDAEELEREKSVVLQEIRMVEDTPDDVIHDIFAAQVWVNHPLGRPILGTRELVTGFSREAIAQYFTDEYVPPRIIIAVAGNVTHERVVELFGAGFNGFAREARPRGSEAATLTPGVNIVHKALEQVHLVMGFPGLPHAAPEPCAARSTSRAPFSPRTVARSSARRRSTSSTAIPCTSATARENAADEAKNVAMSLDVSTIPTPVPTDGSAAAVPTAPPAAWTTSRYSRSRIRMTSAGLASGLRRRTESTCARIACDGIVTALSSAAYWVKASA